MKRLSLGIDGSVDGRRVGVSHHIDKERVVIWGLV